MLIDESRAQSPSEVSYSGEVLGWIHGQSSSHPALLLPYDVHCLKYVILRLIDLLGMKYEERQQILMVCLF